MPPQNDLFNASATLTGTGVRPDPAHACAQTGESYAIHETRHSLSVQAAARERAMLYQEKCGTRREIRVDGIAENHRDAHRRGGDQIRDLKIIGFDDLRRPDQ